MDNDWKDKLEDLRKLKDEGMLPFMMYGYFTQKGVPKDKIDEEVAKLEKDINRMLGQEE